MPINLTIDQRWHIVHLRKDLRLTHRDIASRIGCSHQCVSKVLTHYRKTKNVIDSPRSGRPHSLSIEDEKQLEQAIHSTPNATSNELQSYMKRTSHKIVTSRTIRNERIRLGFYPVHEKYNTN